MQSPGARAIATVVLVAVLIGLVYWQFRVERIVADCLGVGGRWDGPAARCQVPPGRILVRPDLGRG